MLDEFNTLTNESKNRLIYFREISKGCLPILTESGQLLQKCFSDKDAIPLWAIVCHDVLKRIRENIFFISESNPPQTNTSIPLKLCIRSVFSDLILGLFVISHINDTECIAKLGDSLDYAALEGKIKAAECEMEFYTHASDSKYSGFFTPKIDSLKAEIDQIRKKYVSTKPNEIKRWSSIYRLAKTLKESTDITISQCYCVLYGPFKLLSQTEHYAPSNRHESYFSCSSDPFFFHKHALQYEYAIKALCEHINLTVKTI